MAFSRLCDAFFQMCKARIRTHNTSRLYLLLTVARSDLGVIPTFSSRMFANRPGIYSSYRYHCAKSAPFNACAFGTRFLLRPKVGYIDASPHRNTWVFASVQEQVGACPKRLWVGIHTTGSIES